MGPSITIPPNNNKKNQKINIVLSQSLTFCKHFLFCSPQFHNNQSKMLPDHTQRMERRAPRLSNVPILSIIDWQPKIFFDFPFFLIFNSRTAIHACFAVYGYSVFGLRLCISASAKCSQCRTVAYWNRGPLHSHFPQERMSFLFIWDQLSFIYM